VWFSGNGQIGTRVYRPEGTYLRVLAMSAIGSALGGTPHGKSFAVSAYAEIRHAHLCFERQQSLALRELEWEDRLEPMLPWSALILRTLGALAAFCLVLALLV